MGGRRPRGHGRRPDRAVPRARRGRGRGGGRAARGPRRRRADRAHGAGDRGVPLTQPAAARRASRDVTGTTSPSRNCETRRHENGDSPCGGRAQRAAAPDGGGAGDHGERDRQAVDRHVPEAVFGVARTPGVGQPGGRLGVHLPPRARAHPAAAAYLLVQCPPGLVSRAVHADAGRAVAVTDEQGVSTHHVERHGRAPFPMRTARRCAHPVNGMDAVGVRIATPLCDGRWLCDSRARRPFGVTRRGFRRAVGPQRPSDTDDMKNSGTRTGGIAARVNQSFHSRGSVRSVAPTWRRAAQHVERGVVEPEVVVDLGDDLTVLDQVDAVAGEAGEQQRRGVDEPDVPEAGEQEAALGGGDEVVERAVGTPGEQQVVARRRERGAELRGLGAGVGELCDDAVAHPLDATGRGAVVEDADALARAAGGEERLVLEPGRRRVAGQGERQGGEPLADRARPESALRPSCADRPSIDQAR